jgi:hypothetical protein
MSDVSNKTLAILVGIAIIISLVGILSVSRGGVRYISGGATGSGPVSFNATSEVSILVTGSIDWGNGRVNKTAASATLDSDAGTVVGGTWTPVTQYINIENDGTENITVDLNANANNNAAGLIGGTSPSFKMKGVDVDGGCAALETTYTAVPNSTETKFNICPVMTYDVDNDEFKVAAELVIPSDAAAGARNATITFTGTKV